ncbi:MAG: cytochrome c4 [Rhodocyclaceae bacterium]|jgi:cytochrome c553|nr:cytochrome c4 [Rhodocyclaceae bacterium]
MKRSLIALLLCMATASASASETAKPATKGDAARGQAIASTVCGACHAADGNSTISANPKLAGQHEAYLLKQMRNFKAAEGQQPERVNAIMNGMVAAFTDEQLLDMAAYFAAQKQSEGTAKNAASVELGQKIYRSGDLKKGLPACAGCHGPTGAGLPAQYPRIAGQHAEYTEAQLRAFRAEERANDPNKMMRMVAVKMTDPEIKAVSDYIAGLH